MNAKVYGAIVSALVALSALGMALLEVKCNPENVQQRNETVLEVE